MKTLAILGANLRRLARSPRTLIVSAITRC